MFKNEVKKFTVIIQCCIHTKFYDNIFIELSIELKNLLLCYCFL